MDYEAQKNKCGDPKKGEGNKLGHTGHGIH